MDIPSIFCSNCKSLILQSKNCEKCGWDNQGQNEPIGQITYSINSFGSFSSPYITFVISRGSLVFVAQSDHDISQVISVQVQTGSLEWSFELPKKRMLRHLVSTSNQILISSQDAEVFGSHQSDLISLDSKTGEIDWQITLPSHSLTPAAILKEYLFTAGSSGEGYVVSLSNGELINVVPSLPGWTSNPPLIHQNQLFLGSRSNQIYKIPASLKKAQPIIQLDDEELWFDRGLAASGQFLYTPSWDQNLYAIDYKSNNIVWKTPLGRGASSPPVVGQHVYIGIKNRSPETKKRIYGLAAYDLQNGDQSWFFQTEKHVEVPPLVHEDHVFVANRDGQLVALNAADGTLKWVVDLQGRPRTAPIVSGNLLFIGIESGNIFAIPWNDGSFDWSSLESPTTYRRQKKWIAAGTAAALNGEWTKAAQDFVKAGEPAFAARLFAQTENWSKAAPLYLEADEIDNALMAFSEAEDLLAAAQLLLDLERHEEAAPLFEELKDWQAAAENYEQAGMFAQAAPLYNLAGLPDYSAKLYLSIDQPEEAAGVLTDAGRLAEAARIA